MTKKLMMQKRRPSAHKISESLFDNPKRFWSFANASTLLRYTPRNDRKAVTNVYERANLLNTWFSSVFIPSFNNSPPNVQPYNGQSLANIHLTDCEVAQALENLDPNKACGPDNVPGRILKETAREIAFSFCRLFNLSLTLCVFPAAWKRANITPIFKQEDPSLPSNYRPISLLCITSKIFEQCVFNHCYNHLSQFLSESQHGFVKGRSTETQLLETYHYILHFLAKGKEVDVLYLDLSKAFDKVDHLLLLAKLKGYGISALLRKWFRRMEPNVLF